jgi:hypothetical protein
VATQHHQSTLHGTRGAIRQQRRVHALAADLNNHFHVVPHRPSVEVRKGIHMVQVGRHDTAIWAVQVTTGTEALRTSKPTRHSGVGWPGKTGACIHPQTAASSCREAEQGHTHTNRLKAMAATSSSTKPFMMEGMVSAGTSVTKYSSTSKKPILAQAHKQCRKKGA